MLNAVLDGWPTLGVVALFAATAVAIGFVGTAMVRYADRLADLSGLGEASFGAILLGGTTSLSGMVTSVTAASEGYAELAVSNAVGGIAAQTVFLSIADVTYRRANLEHASASVENLLYGSLLSTLLAMVMVAMAGPAIAVWGVHPLSVGLVLGYLFGLRLVNQARSDPSWVPRITSLTEPDVPAANPVSRESQPLMWALFAVSGGVVALAGYVVALCGMELVERTGVSQSLVGVLFTSVATSLPELVTSLAAVRRGALTLAVAGIIGGNCFDVLFIAFADVAYRAGSIYQAVSARELFTVALAQLLTGILLLGLLRRQRSGIGNIGFESALNIVIYIGAVSLLALAT